MRSRNTAHKLLPLKDPATSVRDAYQDVVLKMHELARVLEAVGLDNFGIASRQDADAYHVKMQLALRQLAKLANDNGGSNATH